MYRVLFRHRETRERRLQRPRVPRAVPRVEARAPHDVWVWDVTKIRGPIKGCFYYLAVVIDLYSRFVVGWSLEHTESGAIAEHLFRVTVAHWKVPPGQLVVHADRGSPMTSSSLGDLFETLGIRRSHSRPRCSNDNPHMEASFRGLKYSSAYPGSFDSPEAAKTYLTAAFGTYNHMPHGSLALLTPHDLITGQVDAKLLIHQAALDAAHAAHPTRFVHGAPAAKRPPTSVFINQDRSVGFATAPH